MAIANNPLNELIIAQEKEEFLKENLRRIQAGQPMQAWPGIASVYNPPYTITPPPPFVNVKPKYDMKLYNECKRILEML